MVHIAMMSLPLRRPQNSLVMMNVQFKNIKRLTIIRARNISSIIIGWFLLESGGKVNLRMDGKDYSSVERLLRVRL